MNKVISLWIASSALALTACNSSSPTPTGETKAEAQSVVATPVTNAAAPSADIIAEAARADKLAAASDPAEMEGLRTASIVPKSECIKAGDEYRCPVTIAMELESGAVQSDYLVELKQNASGAWESTR